MSGGPHLHYGPTGGPVRTPLGEPMGPRRPRRNTGMLFPIFFILFVTLFILISGGFIGMLSNVTTGYNGSVSSTKSTIAREKLDSGNAYINDCIIDELGWFDNVSKTEKQLKSFWEETGVQPYIILKEYDASLTTDAQKEQWSQDYYDENFDTENIFLYVYFAEEDTDNDVGYMTYTNGYQTSSVMDSEAVEIFWNNIDKYWYTDYSTDDVFIMAFIKTGETIMKVSTTGKDVMKWIVIALTVLIAGAIIVNIIKQKNKRAKEKAEEDQRILNTSIHDLAKDSLENKYLN